MAINYQQPRMVVEQSPWQTFFEELPGMIFSFQKLNLQAQEQEKDRQFRESQLYIKDQLDTKRMLQKAVIEATNDARDKGLTVNTALDAIFKSSPAHATGTSKKVSSDHANMLAFDVDNLSEALVKINDNIGLANLGARDAEAIDTNFDSIIGLDEIQAYQNTSPQIQELLNSLDIKQLPEAYIKGAESHLGKPAVRKNRDALFDLNRMLRERVEDIDLDTPGLQPDPSDSRIADIQNVLDMIQLGQVSAAAASLKKVTGAQDPFAVEPYGKVSSRILESQGMLVKQDPRMGDVVKRIDPATGDTLDVSPQEAAQTIMTQKDIAKTRKDAGDELKVMDAGEEREQENFDAEQDQRYRSLRTFYESGPLYARKTTSGKFPEKTPKWVKKIYDKSDVLYSLLSRKAFPGVGGKHESDGEMKLIQQDIQKYISEIMTKNKPDAALKKVYDAGPTVDLKARNVLNSPIFQQAVNPRGDGTYDEKEASKNLNELFDLYGLEMLGFDKSSLAQGEAIAHLYNIWFGLEQELIRRKGYSLERQDKQRDYEKVIQGL